MGGSDDWDRLWTPQRLAYIEGADRPAKGDHAAGDGCPFCRSPGDPPDTSLVFARGVHVYGVLNKYPYNPGHVLICPYRHVASYIDLDDAELDEFTSFTRRAISVISTVSAPDGFNVGMNQGGAAGAGIAAHLHQHVVPRWGGDTNFMAVVSGTKVIPQLPADTRDLLSEAWKRVDDPC